MISADAVDVEYRTVPLVFLGQFVTFLRHVALRPARRSVVAGTVELPGCKMVITFFCSGRSCASPEPLKG